MPFSKPLETPDSARRRRLTPVQRAWIVCALVLAVEPVLFAAIQHSFMLPPLQVGLLDAALLLLVMAPILYVLLVRPFQQEIDDSRDLTGRLERARDELEQRVRERSQELQQANSDLVASLVSLENSQRELTQLREMGETLQACRSSTEAQKVLRGYVTDIFHTDGGAIYLFRASRNVLELVLSWGLSEDAPPSFEPDDCWALRRGGYYQIDEEHNGPTCDHLHQVGVEAGLCMPLMAQGETTGLMTLFNSPRGAHAGQDQGFSEDALRVAYAGAQQIGLGLANIRLRETLRDQAVRDPLTGLFNRRYLEESLEREIRRAQRRNIQFSVVMIDVDHFKSFNDRHGHEGGDIVLRDIGRLMRESIRGEDIACRFGGEEFLLMLTECPEACTVERSETLRAAVKQLETMVRGSVMSGVTISCGVAAYPDHGTTPDELIHAADEALYRAKRNGRDQVVTAASEVGQLKPVDV